MKNILLFTFVLAAMPAWTQEIPMAVYPIRNTANLSVEQAAALRSKIISIVANVGYAGTDGGAAVGVQPELIQYEPRTVNAGMRNIVSIEAELILRVQQRDGQVIFGSKTKKFTVSAKDIQQVKSQLIAAIPSNDAAFQSFLQEMKPKIVSYYQENCALLLADAKRKADTDNFGEALSTLMNIPGNSTCRTDADAQLAKVYEQYRNNICRRLMLQAQSATAAKNYAAAAATLRNIDPRSSCYADAQQFTQELRTQAGADFKATLDALVEYWKSESAIEQRRYDIVRAFLKDIF